MALHIGRLSSRRTVYQLSVTLLNIQPSIWRRLLVPADMPLKRLHDALQIAMGWQDCHLFQFAVGDVRYGIAGARIDPEMKKETGVKLKTLLPKPGAKLIYEYDFGDARQHEIVLEEILPWPEHHLLPRCVAGERACPPENSGGYPGYEHLLAVLKDSLHPDHSGMREWVGEDFDPETFDLSAVNFRLGAAFGQ